MVLIDTDILLIEFGYHRDKRREVNKRFLRWVVPHEPALTLYNLMEVLGSLSFNVNERRLREWPAWLVEDYKLRVVWPEVEPLTPEEVIRSILYEQPLVRIRRRMAYSDALVLSLAEVTPGAEGFVTWNARHFREKTPLPVWTPEEWLARQ